MVSAINAIDSSRFHEDKAEQVAQDPSQRVSMIGDVSTEHETPKTKQIISNIECGQTYEAVTLFSAESAKTDCKPVVEAKIKSTDEPIASLV